MPEDLLRAIDLALGGQWDAAHRVVQQDEADPMACWIHAVLHKIEGDLGNSRYWYRRAGKLDFTDWDPSKELRHVQSLLAGPELEH